MKLPSLTVTNLGASSVAEAVSAVRVQHIDIADKKAANKQIAGESFMVEKMMISNNLQK